jgi:Tol biopolymer transport system component
VWIDVYKGRLGAVYLSLPMTIKKYPLICFAIIFLTALATVNFAMAADGSNPKPKLTLDEFFNSVSFDAVRPSPDGHSIVIAIERPDWDQNIFRKELWIYRDDGRGGGSLSLLTQSGHDTAPEWSPDGRWVAFLSDRKMSASKESDSEDDSDSTSKEKEVTQIYLISPAGGEAFPVTEGDEEVHAFAWSPDSKMLYFATRTPWAKAQ